MQELSAGAYMVWTTDGPYRMSQSGMDYAGIDATAPSSESLRSSGTLPQTLVRTSTLSHPFPRPGSMSTLGGMPLPLPLPSLSRNVSTSGGGPPYRVSSTSVSHRSHSGVGLGTGDAVLMAHFGSSSRPSISGAAVPLDDDEDDEDARWSGPAPTSQSRLHQSSSQGPGIQVDAEEEAVAEEGGLGPDPDPEAQEDTEQLDPGSRPEDPVGGGRSEAMRAYAGLPSLRQQQRQQLAELQQQQDMVYHSRLGSDSVGLIGGWVGGWRGGRCTIPDSARILSG